MVVEGTDQFAHAAPGAVLFRVLGIFEIPDSQFLHLLSSGDIIHQMNNIVVFEYDLFLVQRVSGVALIIDLDH